MRGFRPGDVNFVRPIDKPVYAIACSRFCHSLPSPCKRNYAPPLPCLSLPLSLSLSRSLLPPFLFLSLSLHPRIAIGQFISEFNSPYWRSKKKSEKSDSSAVHTNWGWATQKEWFLSCHYVAAKKWFWITLYLTTIRWDKVRLHVIF